jgi:hypothetical protein
LNAVGNIDPVNQEAIVGDPSNDRARVDIVDGIVLFLLGALLVLVGVLVGLLAVETNSGRPATRVTPAPEPKGVIMGQIANPGGVTLTVSGPSPWSTATSAQIYSTGAILDDGNYLVAAQKGGVSCGSATATITNKTPSPPTTNLTCP